MDRNPATEKLLIDSITVSNRHRPVDAEAVRALAASMGQIGLRTPITIRSPNDSECYLVAGRHRLEAAKALGWDEIECFVLNCSEDEAEMWEISENLHRAELTVVQRSEQVARWTSLADKLAQLDPVSKGGRGKESGTRKAARDLNLDRNEVRRALRIASLTEEAKQAAQERGLDDNQSALLAAAVVAPERQVEAIHNFADAKLRAAADKANVPTPKDWSDVEGEQMRRLMAAWNAASPNVKQWFRDQIDTPVMDARFG